MSLSCTSLSRFSILEKTLAIDSSKIDLKSLNKEESLVWITN